MHVDKKMIAILTGCTLMGGIIGGGIGGVIGSFSEHGHRERGENHTRGMQKMMGWGNRSYGERGLLNYDQNKNSQPGGTINQAQLQQTVSASSTKIK